MLALWALVLLSAILFAWIVRINEGIDGVQQANRSLEARAMAHSGLAVAMHPGVTKTSPHLNNRFDHGRSYRVTIESEGGRLNLNYLLAGGDPARLKFLKDYLALRGLTFHEREVLVDCLLDWTAPAGGTRRLNGVPEGPDYHPPHRPLQSVEEIAEVAGSGPLTSLPRWKDDLTLMSRGPLDLEGVSAELLGLVPGIGAQRAQQFVKTRKKLEGGRPDGRAFKDIPEALSYLGISQEQFSQLSGFLGFRDPVQRIRSKGAAGESVHELEVVVQKNGATSQILLWSEK
jgi:hypothetical protein